jgi:Xaa-Pro aminopeptidase
LDEAGIDLLLVTSKHNIRYLLGGYHHHFFAYMDAIGVSRYLPVLAYLRGLPEQAIYVANRNEKDSIEVRRREDREIWVPTVRAASSGTRDAVALAIQHVQSLDRPPRTIGIEAAFLPWDAGSMVVDAFQGAAVVDALRPLERLRAVKTDAELALLRRASELVVDAMLASISAVAPGTSKREVLATLRREETARNLDFDYGLITFGSGLNRAPSDETLSKGDILSIDSGGNLEGYIGDLCRMAILGHPDSELQDLLAEVRSIQDVARRVVRSGVRGGDVVEAGQRAVSHSALA